MKCEALVTAFGLFAVVALAAIDHAVGHELGLSLFYAIPVLLVAREAGLFPGPALAVAAAVAWAVAADVAGAISPTRTWIHSWNTVTPLGYFGMAVARSRSGFECKAAHGRRGPLTGLLNRRGLLEAVQQEVARSRRFGHPLMIAYLDCDDFKVVNGAHGHGASDCPLRHIASLTLSSLRTLDVPTRVGGDEFVPLLPETTAAVAREAPERLMASPRVELNAQGQPVTFSVGAATHACPPESVDALIQTADRVMYRAKQRGKACLEQHVVAPTDANA